MIGVGVWLPSLAGSLSTEDAGAVAAWHGRELLFGAVPAVLSGFLLTALPRWTGGAFASRPLSGMLAALWIAGPASLFLFPAGRAALAAAYLVILSGVVSCLVLAAGSWRNAKIALLMAVLAGAAVVDLLAVPGVADLALRLAVAAILGLVMVLGGRIIPSLTAVHMQRRGEASSLSSSRTIELAAAATAALALGAWVWDSQPFLTAWFGLAAAAAQAARCIQWQPWRTVSRPSILALHGAYACVPLGFGLASIASLAPELVSMSIALHVWAIGAIGSMSMAVMASMIRRHLGPPLRESATLTSALGLLAVALAARAAAELAGPARDLLLLFAALAWIAAHVLFLVRFTSELLLGRSRRRTSRSSPADARSRADGS